MRTRFRRCRACGEYHWTDKWPDNHVEPVPERSALPAPMLALDTMDALWHPHDGRKYESKSEFRAVTKAAGGEEVGNDVQTDNRRVDRVTKDEVAQAIQMVKQGYKPQVDTATTPIASDGWH
jgi:hypothetical protein